MGKKILLVLLLCLFSLLACSEPNEILEPNNDKTLSQEAMVPNIIKQPQLSNYYFVNNQHLELSINAEVTDNGTLTYQWYKNNELIKDAISSSYQEKLSVTENADVQYFCEVTNTLGITKKSVKSQVVTIHLIKDFYSQAVGYTLQIGKSQIIDVMTVGKVEWKSSE
jgi:hypothetical protein